MNDFQRKTSPAPNPPPTISWKIIILPKFSIKGDLRHNWSLAEEEEEGVELEYNFFHEMKQKQLSPW